VLFPESILQRMQLAVGGETLDGGNRRSVGLDREHRAGLHASAINEHGARAALTRIARDVRAGEPQVFAKVVDKEQARLDGCFPCLAVHG
jgi:hypothetical protein